MNKVDTRIVFSPGTARADLNDATIYGEGIEVVLELAISDVVTVPLTGITGNECTQWGMIVETEGAHVAIGEFSAADDDPSNGMLTDVIGPSFVWGGGTPLSTDEELKVMVHNYGDSIDNVRVRIFAARAAVA